MKTLKVNEVARARRQRINALREADKDVEAGRLIQHDEMDALLASWEDDSFVFVTFGEPDPVWRTMLASRLVEDDLSDEECAALEVGMADFRAGRVVSTDKVLETIERMRREQGE